jgi:hypothetical protein
MIFLQALGAIYALWILFVFAMAIQRAGNDRKLNATLKVLAAPVVLYAGVLDVFLNYTVLALLTWDFPRKGEITFSKRLGRLNDNTDWRGGMARWFASLLDPFDPSGKHVQ